MTLVCFLDSVTMPTVPELKRGQVLRVFKDSVTAPAGVRADPDGHMMSPRGEPADGVEGSVYLHKHLHERPRAQCLLPPSVCVNDLSAALLAGNAADGKPCECFDVGKTECNCQDK